MYIGSVCIGTVSYTTVMNDGDDNVNDYAIDPRFQGFIYVLV